MSDSLKEIKKFFDSALPKAETLEALNQLRIDFLGKKGQLTAASKSIGNLSAEERPVFGQKLNELRSGITSKLEEKWTELENAQQNEAIQKEKLDVTLPGRKRIVGGIHPLTLAERKICSIFRSLGFSVETGPDIETDYYNFEALNFPAEHPARDMQDTFFLDNDLLLRTHTSPVQIRTMEERKPPLNVIIPGRVYRHDFDATHSPVFHQVEGLCVGPNVSFAHLKGTLEAFVHMMFGSKIGTRFRPSFFPFTEPSAEVDMECGSCKGKGCRLCKDTGWIEILGCGMVDPNVFEALAPAWEKKGEKENPYDPEKISGFAFGMGIERIAMVIHGIDNIHRFYENDVRFLNQFKGAGR